MTSGGKELSWTWLESSGLQLAGIYLLSCLVIRPEGMRRLGASVGEGRSGGSNYLDPRWMCGTIFASMKAQSPDWIAMGRLRSHGAGFETDQTVSS